MSGKKLRLSRIFQRDKKALILAMDHGSGMGPVPGLINPEIQISQAINGGVDAVLTTYGVANKFPHLFSRTGLILRMDGGFTILTGGFERMNLVINVDAALRLGADAVCCMGFVGGEAEGRSLKYLNQLIQECAPRNIPVMAEMLVMDQEDISSDLVALAVRTGVEAGADFIKTTSTGGMKSFSHVIDGSFKPVLVLGGSKKDDIDLLKSVYTAMRSGAAGAVIGRNIWQHDNPEKISKALSLIVHEEKLPEEAYSKAGLKK